MEGGLAHRCAHLGNQLRVRNLPAFPSHAGDIDVPVHQLRDPGIFQENGKVYLLYSTCGEQGLALAELTVR